MRVGVFGAEPWTNEMRREIEERLAVSDGARRPYLHLFDGGVADNVGMRSVLTVLELMEAFKHEGMPTRLDRVRRIAVFVVNSVSSPRTDWDEREKPPGPINLLLKASGVPIDHYSYEALELLKDKQATEDEERRAQDEVQKLTDRVIAEFADLWAFTLANMTPAD